jgi:hypothetical protein
VRFPPSLLLRVFLLRRPNYMVGSRGMVVFCLFRHCWTTTLYNVVKQHGLVLFHNGVAQHCFTTKHMQANTVGVHSCLWLFLLQSQLPLCPLLTPSCDSEPGQWARGAALQLSA